MTKIGITEIMNRSLIEMEICILLNVGMSKGFWVEAVIMACYLINKLPHASLKGNVVEEVWTCNPIDL